MIQLTDMTLRRGTNALLQHANATLFPGHKVGLVGANGTGKSSLFALLRGELSVDSGAVSVPENWIIAHMAQERAELAQPAIEFVLDGDPALRSAERAIAEAESANDGERLANAHLRYDNADGYTARARAGALLSGLGFATEEHEKPVGEFSGGWRVRLGLAQALMCPSDLLLLDEPTNHLDLEAVMWLEDWLHGYQGTLLLVSHDREFLDGVVGEILHIEQQKLNHYTGTYSDFERQRAANLARQQSLYEKQQREVAHMQKFVDRFRYKASKAKAAQSRLKAIERMEQIAPAHVDSPFHFEFKEPPRAGTPLLSLRGVRLGYGGDPVLERISLSIAPGDRIGLLGPNGAGKSTFVRALAGELVPDAGELEIGANVRIGYFAQHQLEQLDLDASPLQHLRRLSPEASEQKLRNFLGGFDYRGDMAAEPVAPRSGGEKARLVLALLAWQAPNVLLLDEPTNHLDLDMRHALTTALQGFEGAVITVSHDRHLLQSTVDSYLLVAGGRITPFDGDLGDYKAWLDQRSRSGAADASGGSGDTAQRNAASDTKTSDAKKAALQQTDRKAARQAAARERAAVAPLRKKSSSLIRAIDDKSDELKRVDTQIADPELYRSENRSKLEPLLKRQAALREEIATLESEWVEVEARIEAG